MSVTNEDQIKYFLYRRGDGNEGNFIRTIAEVPRGGDPYALLLAFVANDYIPGSKTRKHIIKHAQIDGEEDYGIYLTVFEGPEGQTAFGAAWLTAELDPLDDASLTYYRNQGLKELSYESLDRGAKMIYKNRAIK